MVVLQLIIADFMKAVLGFTWFMVYTTVLNASYEIKSCILLIHFMFSNCLLLCIFFVFFSGLGGHKFLTSNRY